MGLTWGWKSSGDGRRYFSFRTPTGSVTFRFSTLLDNNTEGYVPHRAARGCAGTVPTCAPPVTRRGPLLLAPDYCVSPDSVGRVS